MIAKGQAARQSTRAWKGGLLYRVYVGLIVLFFYAPIFSVMVFSFNSNKSAIRFGSFTFKWYVSLWQNESLIDALIVTVVVAVLATVISTVIGTLGSIGLAEMRKRQKGFVNFILNVNNLPVVNPDIVTAVSLMVLFMSVSAVLPLGLVTMLLAHIAFCTPYVIIQVYPKVLSLDPSEREAAMDLGAKRWQAIYKVMIPDLMPAIVSGAVMAFTMSFDDFIISYFVGGLTYNVSTYIYTQVKRFNPEVDALVSIIFLVIGLGILGVELAKNRQNANADQDDR